VFEILYSLFVSTGDYALINRLPHLINSLYTGFEDKIGKGRFNSIRNSGVDNSWTMVFLKMLFPVLLILFAKNLTTYFSKKIKEGSPGEISNTADPRLGDDPPSNF
jgi:hypothetical protein